MARSAATRHDHHRRLWSGFFFIDPLSAHPHDADIKASSGNAWQAVVDGGGEAAVGSAMRLHTADADRHGFPPTASATRYCSITRVSPWTLHAARVYGVLPCRFSARRPCHCWPRPRAPENRHGSVASAGVGG